MIQTHQRRVLRRAALALLGAACLAVTGPLQARHPGLELDNLGDDAFYEMLDSELDDDDLQYCGFGALNGAHTTRQAYAAIICALGDQGDSDEETELDYDDLQAEMNEAGTTVEAVVWAAIQEADRRASGPLTRAVLVAALRGDAQAPATDSPADPPAWYAQIENGIINPPPNNITAPVKTGLNRARRFRR